MLYRINNYKHSEWFVTNVDTQNTILGIFQSDYDFINHYLNQRYNFVIFENKCKVWGKNLESPVRKTRETLLFSNFNINVN